jgi:hypothetical protein
MNTETKTPYVAAEQMPPKKLYDIIMKLEVLLQTYRKKNGSPEQLQFYEDILLALKTLNGCRAQLMANKVSLQIMKDCNKHMFELNATLETRLRNFETADETSWSLTIDDTYNKLITHLSLD